MPEFVGSLGPWQIVTTQFPLPRAPARHPRTPLPVTPAQAGGQRYVRQRGQGLISPQTRLSVWIPAFAGMTVMVSGYDGGGEWV